ncbi:MAG: Hint domain-containing protein [Albidovulum sp.]|uniref:Hint domain-containing protein n=1 Tax=Albidovulum sp. TaxID=1872424 RepID=UPI003C938006
MPDPIRPLPAHTAHAYDAEVLKVTSGANLGDAIAEAAHCEPGDVYRLAPSATARRLMLRPVGDDPAALCIAEGSEIGQPGEMITLLSALALMAPDGDRVETLFVRHAATGEGYALPLSPLAPRTDYTLIASHEDLGGIRITDIVCTSFAAGTMITLPGGAQRPIEALTPGDEVLTRDHGAQKVRWVGKATMRAIGGFAPVVIAAGALGNLADLVVSPHHRIFIYQRGRRLGGTAELLVQARHLVDGDRVARREGGFVDYCCLVFDRHEIVYAEGIPAESLMVNEATVSRLPAELADEVRARFPGLSQSQHFGTEAGRELLDDTARDALLRRPGRG